MFEMGSRTRERNHALMAILLAATGLVPAVYANNGDKTDLNLLRLTEPGLLGTGVRVAQAEASGTAPNWEVNPPTTGQPVSLFTYYATGGSSGAFPNSLGTESSHADMVGGI